MAEAVPTGMRLYEGEDWKASGHQVAEQMRVCDHEMPLATIILRRIGWIDQNGWVWLSEKDWRDAGGPNGSITPLLINPGCD